MTAAADQPRVIPSAQSARPLQSPPPKTKLVVRRLPATMTEAEFFGVVSRWINDKTCNYKYFVPGHVPRNGTKEPLPATAYAGFRDPQDMARFGREFRTVQELGHEVLVEYAPYQAPLEDDGEEPPVDELAGTIGAHPVYKAFVAHLKDPTVELVPLVAPKPKPKAPTPKPSASQPSSRKGKKKEKASTNASEGASGSEPGSSTKKANKKAPKKKSSKQNVQSQSQGSTENGTAPGKKEGPKESNQSKERKPRNRSKQNPKGNQSASQNGSQNSGTSEQNGNARAPRQNQNQNQNQAQGGGQSKPKQRKPRPPREQQAAPRPSG